MNKILLALIVTLSGVEASYGQLKVTKATNQKIIAGMGGIYMTYTIDFTDKKNETVKIDSVKSIADASLMTFFTDKNRITFRFALQPPPKCKTCVETTPPPPNMTKGVIIYYKRGEKKSKYKVKKFVELEEVVQP
jgi:hypothetical protein